MSRARETAQHLRWALTGETDTTGWEPDKQQSRAKQLGARLLFKAFEKFADRGVDVEHRNLRPGVRKEGIPETFIHEPTIASQHEIRLVRVLPTPRYAVERHCVVKCELYRVSLRDPPAYTALSYTWGAPGAYPIWIDGKILHVQENLLMVLRWLRGYDEPERLLWIDAICINQKDPKEKTEQVAMMGQIYQAAHQVLIWLGPFYERTLAVLDELGRDADAAGVWKVNDAVYSEDHTRLRQLMLRNMHDRGGRKYFYISSIEELLQSPWFTRVWVLQEATLATAATMISHDARLPFYHFACVMELLRIWQMWFPDELNNALFVGRNQQDPNQRDWSKQLPASFILRKRFTESQGKISLLECLMIAHIFGQDNKLVHLNATDPRDRIYGLLGIAEDAEALHITPDYTKSTEAVYTEVAWALLWGGHWEVLTLCRGRKLQSLPTWVPDWTATLSKPWYIAAPRYFRASGKYSGQRLHMHPCSVGSLSLTFLGIRVGDVVDRGYRMVGFRDCIFSEPTPIGIEAIDTRFEEIQAVLLDASVGSFEGSCRVLLNNGSRWFWGLVPHRCEVGDIVVIPLGSPVPFVIRHHTQEQYQLVGEAYVYGAMDGELLETPTYQASAFTLI
ncbi:hypothetical protein H2201_000310 [Coniosporium apollinis]|uniref:Heterokaryon incompatibility domain-containing protein n=2 Tax=Coniosporium TaxID=2810619 RepID=A0ABQ9P994_9PEZI|nr:hypothetical protein H2199_003499 [Cladosporium sp. JES 115]KAJ9669443.1 hypothetical protein H2201_000310 [Coniosporium apollinis]